MEKMKVVFDNYLTFEEGRELLFDVVKEGDTIITLEVPRLARSTKQLCEIIEIVKQKKAQTCDCWKYHSGLYTRQT